MEMHQIRYVLAAAETLNFTRAAGHCSVSQPALTKGVKALESELGAQLFHREGKRILLSEFGRSMLPHLRRIADEAEAARMLARNFRLLTDVPVRIGVMASIGHTHFAPFLEAFEQVHAGVDLAISEARPDQLKAKLSADEIDVAVMACASEAAGQFTMQQIYTEQIVAVLPPDHPLGEKDKLSLSDLSGEPYVDRLGCEMRELVLERCDGEGVELLPRFRSEREDWVQAMVQAGLGFAFMPEYSVTLPGLLCRRIGCGTLVRDVCLVTAPGRPHTPAVSAFMQMARGHAWPV